MIAKTNNSLLDDCGVFFVIPTQEGSSGNIKKRLLTEDPSCVGMTKNTIHSSH